MQKVTFTRRGVLCGALAAAGGLLGGVAGVKPMSAPSRVGKRTRASLALALRKADFERLVGKKFRVSTASGTRKVTLNSVVTMNMSGLPRSPAHLRTSGEQFSLHFTGPASSAFGQGTYSLKGPGVDPVSLLVVPVGLPSQEQEYQSIIVNV